MQPPGTFHSEANPPASRFADYSSTRESRRTPHMRRVQGSVTYDFSLMKKIQCLGRLSRLSLGNGKPLFWAESFEDNASLRA
jgi:hypothetical protein